MIASGMMVAHPIASVFIACPWSQKCKKAEKMLKGAPMQCVMVNDSNNLTKKMGTYHCVKDKQI